MIIDIIMILTAATLCWPLFRPSALRSDKWRATVTPLASIIGSGFLVAGPILAEAAGRWAFLAMAALCAIAYLFGAAIRTNILRVESLSHEDRTPVIRSLERASDIALAIAYFVSVAYYLNLLSAFGLRGAGIVDPMMTQIVTTVILVILGLIGVLRGLSWLEHVELVAVGAKLALIGGLVAALAGADVMAVAQGTLKLPKVDHATGFREIQILLGLVILVQGFETSRYLGAAYPAKLRVQTMRRSQWLSTSIYVTFIALITPYFQPEMPRNGGETAIIDLLQPLSVLVAPFIILTAIGSQLSAAVADMNGAGGLLSDSSNGRVAVKWGYAATTAVALLITWLADIFEIIVYASKAFVIYYGIQCATAALMCVRFKPHMPIRAGLFVVGIGIAIAVVAFGIPAE